jgi:hypothetical protein
VGRNFYRAHRIVVMLPPGEKTTMRWKISHHGHDPRQTDLLAAVALVIMIIAAYSYFRGDTPPPNTTAFIEPSQSVRW